MKKAEMTMTEIVFLILAIALGFGLIVFITNFDLLEKINILPNFNNSSVEKEYVEKLRFIPIDSSGKTDFQYYSGVKWMDIAEGMSATVGDKNVPYKENYASLNEYYYLSSREGVERRIVLKNFDAKAYCPEGYYLSLYVLNILSDPLKIDGLIESEKVLVPKGAVSLGLSCINDAGSFSNQKLIDETKGYTEYYVTFEDNSLVYVDSLSALSLKTRPYSSLSTGQKEIVDFAIAWRDSILTKPATLYYQMGSSEMKAIKICGKKIENSYIFDLKTSSNGESC